MGRAPCCSKDAGLHRGAWNAEEDSILTQYISTHGDGGWRYLPLKAGLKRCGKSCRLRWLNYLRPGIKRGNISADEEELIIRMHKLLGNRWSLIAGRLPGRTDNEIKNYWNTQLVKKLERKECSPPKTKEIYRTSNSPSFCSEDHRVLQTVAVRTTAVRLPKDPYVEVAHITSDDGEMKSQMEVSEIIDDSESWCQSFVDELITGTQFELIDYSSAQNSMESENSPVELIRQRCPTSLPNVVDNLSSNCPDDAGNEVNTCNSTSIFNETPCPPYDFSTGLFKKESESELDNPKELICSLDTT